MPDASVYAGPTRSDAKASLKAFLELEPLLHDLLRAAWVAYELTSELNLEGHRHRSTLHITLWAKVHDLVEQLREKLSAIGARRRVVAQSSVRGGASAPLYAVMMKWSGCRDSAFFVDDSRFDSARASISDLQKEQGSERSTVFDRMVSESIAAAAAPNASSPAGQGYVRFQYLSHHQETFQ